MKTSDRVIASPLIDQNKYYEKFRNRVFKLIFVGHDRLRGKGLDLTQAKEDDITDHIVKEIEAYKKDPKSPKWVDDYVVEQQRPHSSNGEIGDKRKWLDIFFQGNRKENNTEFCFEAKRLYADQKPKRYFLQQGMQRFLLAEYPVNSNREAVMLGYVQSHGIQHWLQWLQNNFDAFRAELCVSAGSGWEEFPIIPELNHSYRTQHTPFPDTHMVLFHLLLSFQ